MPTYQYRCTHCEHELEVVQRFSDSALTVCPQCDGALRKIYNAVGVVFKGSGFYKTDSRTNGENGRKKSSGDSSGTTAEKSASATKSGSEKSGSTSSSGSSEKSSTGSSSTSTKTAAATS